MEIRDCFAAYYPDCKPLLVNANKIQTPVLIDGIQELVSFLISPHTTPSEAALEIEKRCRAQAEHIFDGPSDQFTDRWSTLQSQLASVIADRQIRVPDKGWVSVVDGMLSIAQAVAARADAEREQAGDEAPAPPTSIVPAASSSTEMAKEIEVHI